VLIRKLDPSTFFNAYNVDLQLLYPWEGVAEPPFGAAWAVLRPGESTKPHAHQEFETFFVFRGSGRMSIGGEVAELEAGNVTFHRPFDNHTLTNTGEENLLFLTVWWEDKERWIEAKAVAESTAASRPSRSLVTAAPPTPNGDLHLGHLAGPYLSGDIHARYLRLRGVDAHFICGSDDNSIYTKTRGLELGMGPQAAADHFGEACRETLEKAGIALAAFPRPNASPFHVPAVQEFFRRLFNGGHFEVVERQLPHDPETGEYLFESGLKGRCPHCGSVMVGSTCEDCGRVNDGWNLVDPVSLVSGRPPVWKPMRRLEFPLSRWAGALSEYYRRVSMAPHVRALVEGLLADGLPNVAVTHRTDWGIEVPVPGWEDQRIYVWLEMAPRYSSYARHVNEVSGASGEGWERFWRSPEAEVVQFFGFDNSFYYAALLPALFLAYDAEIRLPKAFVTNEFYYLDGQKFSTSRNHRILGRELAGKAPRDAVRYYLAATCPEREETNFTLAGFHDAARRELLGSWEVWMHDLAERLAARWQNTVPSTGDWTEDHRRFYHRLRELSAEAAAAYEAAGFSPQRATRAMDTLVREARRFGQGEKHWQGVATRTEENRTGIALEVLALKVLGQIAAPILPELAERLWRALGQATGPGAGQWEETLEWVPSGTLVQGLEKPLFPGLADYLAATDG
jgi:methionyl-tRNA synthetase